MTPDQKRVAEAKRKFDLHVLLLQERMGLNKTTATVEAYVAGMAGLDLLMRSVPIPGQQFRQPAEADKASK